MSDEKFPGDEVEGWAPLTFALAFVRQMRKERRLSHRPSLRTTLAVPKLLTARYFRTQRLTPQDYIEAAVFNTPYEDQEIAERVAREILFPPKPTAAKASKHKNKKNDNDNGDGEDEAEADESPSAEDAIANILGDLAGANIDLESMGSLEALLDQEQEDEAFQAYDLFEALMDSGDDAERSLAELIILLGGPSRLEVHGANTRERIIEFIRDSLRGLIGSLTPEHILHGCRSYYGPMLRQLTRLPWELAGALAGTDDNDLLDDHLDDMVQHGSTRELGKILRFLSVFEGAMDEARVEDFRAAGIQRAEDLLDFVALLDGLEEWVEPPEELVRHSARQSPIRALQAADWIRSRFDRSLHQQIFNEWLAGLESEPTLEQLVDVAVACPKWEELLDKAYQRYVDEIRGVMETHDYAQGLPTAAMESVRVAQRIRHIGNTLTTLMAGLLSTDITCLVSELFEVEETTAETNGADIAEANSGVALSEDQTLDSLEQRGQLFLSLLDAFIEHHCPPNDVDRLIAAAEHLEIEASEIYDRLGNALSQFQLMVEGNARDPARYQLLSQRIDAIADETMAELSRTCHSTGNQEGMAVLLAVDMGSACEQGLPTDFVVGSICFKGIGGGANLLKQWFTCNNRVTGEVRGRIKALAKDALIELAMDWLARGTGSAGQGLMPQNRARPFTSADDLDLLDIENTLDALIGAGKSLEEMSEDELFVHDTESGKASFAVLIDISGSMSGPELSTCAISIVMLLGRLKSEEVAVALFESDTHVVKTFDQERSLDEVADELLELNSFGGTCVDQALAWASEQFLADRAERQILFLLSDFCFFESPEEIAAHARRLADQQVRFLGASHGPSMQESIDPFLEAMTGDHVRLTQFERLPIVLMEAINSIGDSE